VRLEAPNAATIGTLIERILKSAKRFADETRVK